VAGAIRERERATGGHLPVIALTARSRKEDRERCLRAGMDDFLSKPVKAAELVAAISRAVPTGSRSGSAGANAELLDPAVLLAACGDDPDGLRGLCEDLQAYAPARLAELNDALRHGDAPRLREAAHKLCGLLSAFSTTAGTLAAELEDRAAAGRLDEAGPLAGRLETMTLDLTAQVSELTVEALRDRLAAG
jgi:HPt (histidine-containing phosphotransfer) domain-containing protein